MSVAKIHHDEWVKELFRQDQPPRNALTIYQLSEKMGFGLSQTKIKVMQKVKSGELIKKTIRNKNYYWPANDKENAGNSGKHKANTERTGTVATNRSDRKNRKTTEAKKLKGNRRRN